MSIRSYFIIAAIAALSFGIGFVLVPQFIAAIFGVVLDDNGVLMTRFFGVLLVTTGIWFSLLRETDNTAVIRAMLTGYLVGDIFGGLNALYGVLSGTMNVLGWLIVLLYFGLAVGAVYFLTVRPSVRVVRTGAR